MSGFLRKEKNKKNSEAAILGKKAMRKEKFQTPCAMFIAWK